MKIELKGPVAFMPTPNLQSIFECPDAGAPGIYLWTVFTSDTYWVNYVGISEGCIVQRISEHFRSYFKGEYTIYDSAKFRTLEKSTVYGGNRDPSEFRQRFSELSNHIIPMLFVYRVFYAPCQMNRQTLEQMESTLILRLQGDPNAKEFLDNARRSRTDGVPIDLDVSIPEGHTIMGLNRGR